MSDDRRTSVRRDATLPFTWQTTTATASLAELCRQLDVPAALALQSRMAELDEELRRLAGALDARTADALRVLDGKVALLEEALLAQSRLPPQRLLTVSADGLGFVEADPVPVGEWIAVHLVLPVSYHLVCRARVTRCEPAEHGFGIGAAFVDLGPPAGRRLTRYAIGRERDQDA